MKLAFKKEGLEAKELAFVNGIETAINAAWEATEQGLVTQKGLDAKLLDITKSINEKALTAEQMKDFTDMIQSVKDQAIAIQKIKDQGIKGERSEMHKSIAQQLRAYIEQSPEQYEEFKAGNIKFFGAPTVTKKKNKTTGAEAEEVKGGFNLVFKAAGNMTQGNAIVGYPNAYLPYPEIVPGFTDLARNQPFIEQYTNSSSTTSPLIVWVNKINPDGNAAMTPEGGLKPLIDFQLDTEVSRAKKVTDKIKISTEMIDDIDFIAAEIENELKYKVDMLVDDQLFGGDGTGNNLKGIKTYAGGYVLTTIKTTTPNDADAIRAGIAQVRTLNFRANYAFISTVDEANMDLTKNTQGSYIIPPFQSSTGLTISGVQVVSTNNLNADEVIIADMTRYKVRNYKLFAISYGWVADDFELNLFTVLGERRLHAYASENETGAFLYDTLSNIKTAITA